MFVIYLKEPSSKSLLFRNWTSLVALNICDSLEQLDCKSNSFGNWLSCLWVIKANKHIRLALSLENQTYTLIVYKN